MAVQHGVSVKEDPPCVDIKAHSKVMIIYKLKQRMNIISYISARYVLLDATEFYTLHLTLDIKMY